MTLISRRNIMLAAGIAAAAALTAGALIATSADASVATGAQAPNFTVTDATGATRSLSEFNGRTVILEWTNRDCPYVRKYYNAGAMQALQRETTEDGIVWLQVLSSAPGEQGHFDAAGARANMQAANGAPSHILLDPQGAVGRAYGARTTPHMYIINPEGRLVYQGAIDNRPSANPRSLEGATNYVRAALTDIEAGRPVQIAETTAYGCDVKYAD